MSELEINEDRCTLCGACVRVCPFDALEIEDGELRVNARCTLCGACVEACPEDALRVPEGAGKGNLDKADWSGIWVMAQRQEGALHRATGELVGAASRLAAPRKCSLGVLALGGELEGLADEMAGWPVDVLMLCEHPHLEDTAAEHRAAALAHLVESDNPETILAPATALWRSILPRAASLLHTGLTADCTGLETARENGRLLQTRPAFGGDVMATITCPKHRPEMATVRPGVMKPPEQNGSAPPEVRRIRPPDGVFDTGTELLDVRRSEKDAASIADADVIFAGGRGLGGPEGFDVLREAADELGGEVASSRPPVDAGWMPYPRQVGQTGTTVQPQLYVACGISGSVQHRVGMQSSEVIVAVNTDPDAPIFDIADYGIVGDYREVLPALTAELKERRRAHVSGS